MSKPRFMAFHARLSVTRASGASGAKTRSALTKLWVREIAASLSDLLYCELPQSKNWRKVYDARSRTPRGLHQENMQEVEKLRGGGVGVVTRI
jgi:hypothetical protein